MELLVAVLGPILGGAFSIIIWQSKNNSQQIQDSIKLLHGCVEQVDDKVTTMSIDNVRNFATKDELMKHEEKEEHRYDVFREEMEEMKGDIKSIKDTQWKIILNNNKSI